MKTGNETESEVRAKADEFIQRLHGTSVQDLHSMINHDSVSPARLGLTRKSSLKGHEWAIEAFLAMEAEEDAVTSKSLVEYSSKLSEEELRLQMEIAKAQGTLDYSLALTKLKGERIDPFQDDDDRTEEK